MKKSEKRHIAAHKGGRTARLPAARITPESLDRLQAILAELDLSVGDWATEIIIRQSERLADDREKINNLKGSTLDKKYILGL